MRYITLKEKKTSAGSTKLLQLVTVDPGWASTGYVSEITVVQKGILLMVDTGMLEQNFWTSEQRMKEKKLLFNTIVPLLLAKQEAPTNTSSRDSLGMLLSSFFICRKHFFFTLVLNLNYAKAEVTQCANYCFLVRSKEAGLPGGNRLPDKWNMQIPLWKSPYLVEPKTFFIVRLPCQPKHWAVGAKQIIRWFLTVILITPTAWLVQSWFVQANNCAGAEGNCNKLKPHWNLLNPECFCTQYSPPFFSFYDKAPSSWECIMQQIKTRSNTLHSTWYASAASGTSVTKHRIINLSILNKLLAWKQPTVTLLWSPGFLLISIGISIWASRRDGMRRWDKLLGGGEMGGCLSCLNLTCIVLFSLAFWYGQNNTKTCWQKAIWCNLDFPQLSGAISAGIVLVHAGIQIAEKGGFVSSTQSDRTSSSSLLIRRGDFFFARQQFISLMPGWQWQLSSIFMVIFMCTIAWENFERAVYITAWPSSSLQSAALQSRTIYAQSTLSNRGHLEAVSAQANSCTHIYPPAIYGGDWGGGGAGGVPVIRCDLTGRGQHRRQWG